MIKNLILATIILLPCFAILNDNENFLVNLFGICYIFALYFAAKKTRIGRKFAEQVYKDGERLNEIIINKMK